MRNSMNTPPTIRWKLLSTVSAFALLASVYTAGDAEAASNDTDRPLIWVELGGEMDNITGQGEIFAPAFIAANPTSSVLLKVTPLQAQKPPIFNFGEDARVSFQPEDSDWIFSAAIRYGRSSSSRHVDHQTSAVHYKYFNGVRGQPQTAENFADTRVERSERQAILDFSAGKDVGLGLLGRNSSSTLSLGVRFAQFESKENFDIRARPDMQVKYVPSSSALTRIPIKNFHTYHATGHAARSFRGVGPALSWNGSAAVAGNLQEGAVTVDWGVNAALLFGKQRAHVQHQESGNKVHFTYYTQVYHNPPTGHVANRSVTVPNVGGSVGLSWRVQDFKVSLGYRADFFFGAIDGGIDARKNEPLGFKGPFASISVGLGD